MSDDELVAWVGEHLVEPSGIGGLYRPSPRYAWHTGDGDEWRPLDDLNHAMQVVAAMRAKGWRFDWDEWDEPFGFEIGFMKYEDKIDESSHKRLPNGSDDAAQRRAILLAAKQALESTEKTL